VLLLLYTVKTFYKPAVLATEHSIVEKEQNAPIFSLQICSFS